MERWIFLSVLHRGAMHVHHRGLEKQQPVVSVHIINHASAFFASLAGPRKPNIYLFLSVETIKQGTAKSTNKNQPCKNKSSLVATLQLDHILETQRSLWVFPQHYCSRSYMHRL
jgi:hypothetical protein